jgi:hypothetical protein
MQSGVAAIKHGLIDPLISLGIVVSLNNISKQAAPLACGRGDLAKGATW